MPSDPIRDIWSRVRSLGRKMEEEIYDFTEEDAEREEEPRGRNTLIALLNGFFTMWKASKATPAERTLGVLGFAGVFWLVVVDRGLAYRRWYFGLPAATFAIIWFIPGAIAAGWMMGVNLGWVNLRKIRAWPLMIVFGLSGLIGFRGVFSGLARKRMAPLARREQPPPDD